MLRAPFARRALALAPFLLASLFAAPALATVVTIPASKDNTLYESATGDVSNGAGEHLFTGRTRDGFVRRAVLRFDIAAAIPAGSVINSVSLQLTVSRVATNTLRPTSLYRLTADWGEGASNAGTSGGAGAAATAGDATWIHRFFNTDLWAAAGGDFAAGASASQAVGVEGPYSWSSAGLVADAQAWLDTPSSNHGWLLLGNETASQSVKRFDTREAVSESARPKLTLEFTLPGTPAETTSWGRIRASYR